MNGRYIRKRLHVRVEHVQPSRCREDFLRRREENDRIKHEAKERGGEGASREGVGQEGRNRSRSSSSSTAAVAPPLPLSPSPAAAAGGMGMLGANVGG